MPAELVFSNGASVKVIATVQEVADALGAPGRQIASLPLMPETIQELAAAAG